MSRDRLFLLHLQEAILSIQSYVSAGRGEYLQDRKTQDAVARNLEIIGEAVKNLAEETLKRSPGIPWRRIAGMRDRLIHGYFSVDLNLVWETISCDLPVLLQEVQKLLEEENSGQE